MVTVRSSLYSDNHGVQDNATPDARKLDRALHYHTLATPLMQRRFARAVFLTSFIAYAVGYLIGHGHLIWSLFPWTKSMARCLVITMSLFPIFILRKARMHVAYHSKSTPIGTVLYRLCKRSTVHTVIAYMCSAASFLFLYWLSNSGKSSTMRLVTRRENELPRLNEKLIYFCFNITQLAILSALVHTGVDGDRLRMPTATMPLTRRIKRMLPSVLFSTLYMTAFNCTLAPISYFFLRRTIYFTTLRIAYLFVRLSPSKAMPLYPFSLGLLYHSFKASFFCCVLWQTAQANFNVYMSQTPIIQGLTISQKSSDPNTSLLSGLKTSEKALTQAMAYQELVYIAFSVPSRRQTIFEDLDKRTWINIMQECLSQVDEVAQSNKPRITESSRTEINPQIARKQPSSTSMTLKSDNIFPPPQQSLIHRLSVAEASKEKSKDQTNVPSLLDRVKELYGAKVAPYINSFELSLVSRAVQRDIELDSQLRIPNLFILECAITALCQLVVASREEDRLGVVQRDIPKILEQCFTCLDVLEDNFKKDYLPITKDESSLQHTNHKICINSLRHGSQTIVETFSENLKDLNLSTKAVAKAQALSKDIWERSPPVGDSWVII